MKFGVREICDVVLKKKAGGFFGDLYLDKGMPVLYFDTMKTSSLEGQSSTVYAQGGPGNARLVAWEGDRTVTFTMEDALISPESFSILSGAGFMNADSQVPIYVHITEECEIKNDESGAYIKLKYAPSEKGSLYLMFKNEDGSLDTNRVPIEIPLGEDRSYVSGRTIVLEDAFLAWQEVYNTNLAHQKLFDAGKIFDATAPVLGTDYTIGSIAYLDYYVERTSGVKQIDIEASKFGGSYYLEASTLFRDQATGEDMPAEFIIPNCKVQSNFTFTMAPTGDPSTFTFTLDAFPDYTKFNKIKKVIAALQIIEDQVEPDPDSGIDGRVGDSYAVAGRAVDKTDKD